MGIELIKPDTNIDFMGKRKLAAFFVYFSDFDRTY